MKSSLFSQLRRSDSTTTCLVIFLPLIAVLTSCSSSPSARDGERVVEDRIKKESEGRIKMAKFQKTNGARGELMGLKIYALEFDAQIEFRENCKWITGMFGQQLSFRTSKSVAAPASGFGWNKFLDDSQNPGALVTKGQKVQISGVVRFVKKENGWAAENMELTRSTLIAGSAGEPGDPAKNSKSCVNNLKQIGLSARFWSTDHNEAFPPDFLTMSNQLISPSILVCPSDTNKTNAQDWLHFKPARNVTYEFLTPNAKETAIVNQPAFRCPIHGYIAMGNGDVKEQ